MPTGNAHESPHADAEAAVAATVAAARRRVRLVRFAGAASVGVPGGAVAAAALALAGVAPAWAPVALALLTAAATMTWAIATTPAPADAAALLDARLGLRDRVTAALQLRGDDGPIATLVTRDAAARLEGVKLTAIFPFTLSRAATVSMTLAAALSGWLAWSGVPGTTTTPATAGARDAGAGVDSSRGAGPRAASRGTANGGATPAAGRAATSTIERTPPQRPQGAMNGAQAASTGQRAAPDTRPAPQASQARGDLIGRGGPTGSAPATPGDARRSGSGAAGTAAAGRLAAGAGGVAQGGALTSTPDTTGTPALTAESYQAARAKAEAALARDVVPPDYRDDVRAYFRAIAPGGSR